MDRQAMLQALGARGEDAGSDYDDSDEVAGWFGWTVEPGVSASVLTVTHRPADGEQSTARWQLIPMGITPQPPAEAPQPAVIEHTEGRW